MTNVHLTGTGLQRLLIPWSDAAWPRTSAMQAQVQQRVVPEDQSIVLAIERLYGADASVEVAIAGPRGIETRQLDGLRGPWRLAFNGAPGVTFYGALG